VEDVIRPADVLATKNVELVNMIKVSPQSQRVFVSMFPSQSEEHVAKPLEWTKFVEAMRDAGFAAAHSGGSAMVFTKDGQGRIVFHKPHPVAKIDQTMLQSWGRRMQKWFHWGRETFVKDIKG
jgi:predicted RNA binding protein YcfA (HicA-like mRNA interferase family)